MTKALRIGIAGYGVVGKRRRHFIDRQADLETVAVCDRTFPESGVFDDGLRYFTNYHDLLKEDLDALFICLTNDIAPDVTIAGLEKGLHVFCEKPPGRTVGDVECMIECEGRHPDLILKFGFNHRHHDSVRDALEYLASGELGQVINMRGVYGKSKFVSFGAHSDWRINRDIAGGGILLDQGIHMVDLMRLFGGEFNEVQSIVSNDFWKHDVEDNAYALMRSDRGVVAMLHSTATQWRHRFSLEITLEKGALALSGILSGSKSYGAEKLTVAWADDDDQGDPKEQTTTYNNDPSWEREIAEFADAIRNGPEQMSGTSQDALLTMELVYRIYKGDSDWCQRWHI